MKSEWSCLTLLMMLFTSTPVLALDDPTRPPTPVTRSAEAAPKPVFSLDSIMFGPRKRVAVIDGVARRQGEEFGNGVKLLRVYPDRVRLLVNGQPLVLHWVAESQVRVPQ